MVIGFCCSCGGGEECVREGKAVDTTGVTVQREGERQKKKGFDTQILNQNTHKHGAALLALGMGAPGLSGLQSASWKTYLP